MNDIPEIKSKEKNWSSLYNQDGFLSFKLSLPLKTIRKLNYKIKLLSRHYTMYITWLLFWQNGKEKISWVLPLQCISAWGHFPDSNSGKKNYPILVSNRVRDEKWRCWSIWNKWSNILQKGSYTEKNFPICPGIPIIFDCIVTWPNSGWNSTRPSKGLPETFKLRYI